MTTAIALHRVCKAFRRGKYVLSDVSVEIGRGEMVALVGASGSGKSTMIRSIAGLIPIDDAKDGRITIFGSTIQAGGRVARSAQDVRSRIGVVFQQYNLVPRLSVLRNVCLGRLGRINAWRGTFGRFNREEKLMAMRALARVGIAEHALRRAAELSGGQQQRAAIARSLIQGADILIADEPIASLDPKSARRVMDILSEINRKDAITVLVSLHQIEYALHYCPRTIALREGRVVYDGPSSALTPAFLAELYGSDSEELLLPGIEARWSGTEAMRPVEDRSIGAMAEPSAI